MSLKACLCLCQNGGTEGLSLSLSVGVTEGLSLSLSVDGTEGLSLSVSWWH